MGSRPAISPPSQKVIRRAFCASAVGKLAHLSSVAISYRNNFMIDCTLRQNHSAPLFFINYTLIELLVTDVYNKLEPPPSLEN